MSNSKIKALALISTLAITGGALAFPMVNKLSAISPQLQNAKGASSWGDLNKHLTEVNSISSPAVIYPAPTVAFAEVSNYGNSVVTETPEVSNLPVVEAPEVVNVPEVVASPVYKTLNPVTVHPITVVQDAFDSASEEFLSDSGSYFHHFFDDYPEFNAKKYKWQYSKEGYLISATFKITWGGESFKIKLFVDKNNKFWHVGGFEIYKGDSDEWIKKQTFTNVRIDRPAKAHFSNPEFDNDLKNEWYSKVVASKNANKLAVFKGLRGFLNSISPWVSADSNSSRQAIENLFNNDANFSYLNDAKKFSWEGSSIIFQVRARNGRARDVIVRTKKTNGVYSITGARVYDMSGRRGTYMNYDLTGSKYWNKSIFWDWVEWCDSNITGDSSTLSNQLKTIKAILVRK